MYGYLSMFCRMNPRDWQAAACEYLGISREEHEMVLKVCGGYADLYEYACDLMMHPHSDVFASLGIDVAAVMAGVETEKKTLPTATKYGRRNPRREQLLEWQGLLPLWGTERL